MSFYLVTLQIQQLNLENRYTKLYLEMHYKIFVKNKNSTVPWYWFHANSKCQSIPYPFPHLYTHCVKPSCPQATADPHLFTAKRHRWLWWQEAVGSRGGRMCRSFPEKFGIPSWLRFQASNKRMTGRVAAVLKVCEEMREASHQFMGMNGHD